MIWRRKNVKKNKFTAEPRSGDPDMVLKQAREILGGLRILVAEFRAHLDELEAETQRSPDQEEV